MKSIAIPTGLDEWALNVLANPVTKQPADIESFFSLRGIPDARVFLSNSPDFHKWKDGQEHYEGWSKSEKNNEVERFLEEIELDRPTYEYFQMEGSILDVGGGIGTVRQFLGADSQYLSMDPFLGVTEQVPTAKVEAYTSLSGPLNFVYGCAEFLPFRSSTFDWVHMRSMLDHVQSPDLSIIEAWRVLANGGKILIGLSVEGGRPGSPAPLPDRNKRSIRQIVGSLLDGKAEPEHDHHVWSPTFSNLRDLVEKNGFSIRDCYWQPGWDDRVVYLLAEKVNFPNTPPLNRIE